MKRLLLIALLAGGAMLAATMPSSVAPHRARVGAVLTKGTVTVHVLLTDSLPGQSADTLMVFVRSSNPDPIPEFLLRATYIDAEGETRTKDQVIHTYPFPARDQNRDDLAMIYFGCAVQRLISLEVTEQRPSTVFSLDGISQ